MDEEDNNLRKRPPTLDEDDEDNLRKRPRRTLRKYDLEKISIYSTRNLQQNVAKTLQGKFLSIV
jgi:hypothetical protein